MADRVLAIAGKEVRELLRDPVYLGLALIVPLALMLLFGYGFGMDVKHLPVAIVDHDRTPASRDYADAYLNSEYFDLVGLLGSAREADALLRTGRARVVLDIPPDFSRRLAARGPVAVGITVDGSFPTRAQVALGYVAAINALYNERLVLASGATGAPARLPVILETAVRYNPSLESKNFVVPGMLVVIMMFFPALLGALLIVRERELGTIFNFFASPVRRWEILAGKALPYVGVAFLDYLAIFAMSVWLFRVRFVGSFWVLSAGALLYAACTIGIGLLVSVLTRSQLAAMLVTFLGTMTPAFNFSGFLSPVASQDAVGQVAARLIPATYFMELVRGSYLKGLGFSSYWPHLLTLGLYASIVYALAWFALRKRVA